MKRIFWIFQIGCIMTMTFLVNSAFPAQANPAKLSPGTYMGHFNYSVDRWVASNVGGGGGQIGIDYQTDFEVQGTLVITVDKNGKIKPGVQIVPNRVTTYDIHSVHFSEGDCNGTGYLGGEAKATIKHDRSTAFDPSAPGFTASLSVGYISPTNYEKWGSTTDCPPAVSKQVLEKATNALIQVLNNHKSMKFLVVSMSENSISGTVYMPGVAVKLDGPGGMGGLKDPDGFFIVYKTDLLAPLDDGSLAPLTDWRTK